MQWASSMAMRLGLRFASISGKPATRSRSGAMNKNCRLPLRLHPLLIADLIDHYVEAELSPNADWHSHATRVVYRYYLKKWIQPHWGEMGLCAVRTMAVEHWLRG